MLLQASTTVSWGLTVILFTWFLASWYLFRMMQRLLFGAHPADVRYQDLHTNEVAVFALLLLGLIALGAMPPRWFETVLLARGSAIPWR
jgi:NADH:ubiquinone oxidoreductase subunit 4 (subunit M)